MQFIIVRIIAFTNSCDVCMLYAFGYSRTVSAAASESTLSRVRLNRMTFKARTKTEVPCKAAGCKGPDATKVKPGKR